MPRQKKDMTDAPPTDAAPEAIQSPAAETPKRRRPTRASKPTPAAEEQPAAAPEAPAPAPADPQPEPEPEQELKPEPLLSLLEVGLKKKDRNETHDKDRVHIRKDLKARLDAVAEGRSKGFKTLLLNYGLEKALEELEQAEAQRKGEA